MNYEHIDGAPAGEEAQAPGEGLEPEVVAELQVLEERLGGVHGNHHLAYNHQPFHYPNQFPGLSTAPGTMSNRPLILPSDYLNARLHP